MLKDERLFELSKKYNVARFISVAPDTHLRYHAVHDKFTICDTGHFESVLHMFYYELNKHNQSSTSLNIRTFKEDCEQGCPFIYGLTDLHDIRTKIYNLTSQGYYCIIFETIDVTDGGLSGCIYQNGILNISPGLTPRGMETDDEPVASFKTDSYILKYLEARHNFKFSDFDFDDGKRYEFTICANPVGYRNTNYVVWEISNLDYDGTFNTVQRWPSKLSKHISDKLYGLLVAKDYNIPILRTDVFMIEDYKFKSIMSMNEYQNHSNEKIIIRPCPHEQQPGKFDSLIISYYDIMLYGLYDNVNRYLDEDFFKYHDTCIIQPYMDAIYSGAYLTTSSKEIHIEGVYGNGDEFMVNKREPEELPDHILNTITTLAKNINKQLNAYTRGEWIIISEKGQLKPYLMQLHCDSGTTNLTNNKIYIYETDELIFMYHKWSPSEGLDKLRKLIKEIETTRYMKTIDPTRPSHDFGIEINGFIGLTTHAADLLRKYKINSIMYT